MIVLQPSPNDLHNSFNTTRSLDLTNTSIANYSAIAPQTIQSSMYQTAAQYQSPQQPQASFVYSPAASNSLNNQAQYVAAAAAAHSRSSSTSSLPRNSTTDNNSFTIDTNSYYRYEPTSTASATNMNNGIGNADSRSSAQTSPTLTSQSTTVDNPASSNTNSLGVNVLPPLSEVLQQQQQNQQQNSCSQATSQTSSQVVPNVQTQSSTPTNNLAVNMNTSASQSVAAGFYQSMQQYPDVNTASTYATAPQDGSYTTQSSLQQAINQQQQQVLNQQAISQQQTLNQQSQIASNLTGVDPRTLPPIVGTGAEIQAGISMIDPSGRRSSSLLAINTAGLTVAGTDQSPMSATSSGASPILSAGPGNTTTITYHSQQQATLLNGHFMAAAQSMNNVLMPPQRAITGRRRSEPSNESSSLDRPQKIYSFVPLPGINTKKRPRRRYDEIERHYACNWSGCTKAYGTLNHLNAHVQMQKHGPKRHPSEFKELRKQWRRQKREEEERKAADASAVKQNSALLNGNLTSI